MSTGALLATAGGTWRAARPYNRLSSWEPPAGRDEQGQLTATGPSVSATGTGPPIDEEADDDHLRFDWENET